MKRAASVTLGVVVVSGLLGMGWFASGQPRAGDAGSVASLDGQSISAQELREFLDGLPEALRQRLGHDRNAGEQLLKRLLIERALAAEAERNGLAERPEVLGRLEQARRQVLSQAYLQDIGRPETGYPGEEALRQAYEQARPELKTQVRYRLAQIFLAAPADRPEAVRAAGEQARQLAQRASAKADFAALAKEFSEDAASAAQGGDHGFVSLGGLLPEVRAAVLGLQPGQVSAPVQSAAGWHVIKLLALEPARTPEFDEVKEELRQRLLLQRQRALQQAYLDERMDKAAFSLDGAALQSILRP